MERLRVLTLNIWHKQEPWEARAALIRRGLSELSPDVVGLQEVLVSHTGAGSQNLADQLDPEDLYQRRFASARDIGPYLSFGNALFSRWPILEDARLPLPGEESGETRSSLYALLDSPHGRLPVFVTHLNWKLNHGAVRVRQVRALVDQVHERCRGQKLLPAVILGDFNAEPEADEIRYLRGHATLEGRSEYFADAWAWAGDGSPGHTFDRRNSYAARSHEPPRRLDYIFVRGPDEQLRGEPLETRLVFDAPEGDVWASDYFGLYTELAMSPRVAGT